MKTEMGTIVVFRCSKCNNDTFRITRDGQAICTKCRTTFAKADWYIWK